MLDTCAWGSPFAWGAAVSTRGCGCQQTLQTHRDSGHILSSPGSVQFRLSDQRPVTAPRDAGLGCHQPDDVTSHARDDVILQGRGRMASPGRGWGVGDLRWRQLDPRHSGAATYRDGSQQLACGQAWWSVVRADLDTSRLDLYYQANDLN